MNEKIEKKNEFKIQYYKGDTYALKITFKNVAEDLTTAFFTVKENVDDETPLIEKSLGSGIELIDENFYRNEVVYKLQLQTEDSVNLQADFQYLYDLKVSVGNVVKTVISGVFIVRHCVTGADKIITTLAEIEVDDVIGTDFETTPATHGIEYEQDPIAMAKIGDVTQLNTTAKNNLVSAINEVNTKAEATAEEIEKIEDGTVSVPNATNADIAQYASDDITKGTIEERLTNLGFRQGTFGLDTSGSYALVDGVQRPECVQTTINTNVIKRQGNYCIGSFKITWTDVEPDPPPTSSLSYRHNLVITIPENFRPKEETLVALVDSNYSKTTTSIGIIIGAYLRIYPNGQCVFEGGVSPYTNNIDSVMMLNAGWEAQPIE